MSTATAETRSKMKAHATKLFKVLMNLTLQLRTSGMQLGLVAHEMKIKNLFPLLGFADENSCRVKLQIGRSTWFRYIRIREGYKKLSGQRFLKLIAENAEHGLRLTEEERYSEQWLKRAESMKEEDFEKLVIKAVAKGRGIPEDDLRVWFKMKMIEGRRRNINSIVEEFCREHGIEDPAEGLELALVEMKNGPKVMMAVKGTIVELRAANSLIDELKPENPKLGVLQSAVEKHIKAMQDACGLK